MSDLKSVAYGLIFFVGGCLLAAANEGPQSLFYQGNEAYGQGRYSEAIQAYEAILAYGESPELYFNLQEAYLQEGLIGKALIAYERLELLAPYSKLRTPAFEKIQPYYQKPQWSLAQRLARVLPSPNGCPVALGISFWGLASVGLWLHRFRKTMSYILLILSLGGLIGSGLACWGWQTYQKVGMTLSSTPLKLAPTPQSPHIETLALGAWVRLEKRTEDYCLVVLPHGKKGWLAAEELGWLIGKKGV